MSNFTNSNLEDDKLVKKSKKLTDLLNGVSEISHRNAVYNGMSEYLKSTLIQENLERDSYYSLLSQYRDNWIVNGIYDILINDIFVDSGYNNCIKVSIEKGKGKFEKEAENLFRRLNIYDVLQSISPDLLHYGSYPLKIVTDKRQGVIALIDDIEPQHVIPIADSANRPICYFVDESVHNPRQQSVAFGTTPHEYNYYDITQVLYLSLDLDFLKLKLPVDFSEKLNTRIKENREGIKNILKIYYEIDLSRKNGTVVKKSKRVYDNIEDPDFVDESEDLNEELEDELNQLIPGTVKLRCSKSFIWGILDKLKDTILLNKIYVYNNMASMLAPKLIGVPVPNVYDPKQLIDVVQQYEQLLNVDLSKITFSNDFNNINLSDIVKVKPIPIVGERSTPSQIDYGARENPTDLDKIRENLSETLNSAGIPAELFNGSTDAKSNIKTNVRYAKKVKKIQRNLAKALKHLLLIHFAYKFPDDIITLDDINIQFKNNVNIDELENMEAQDLVISASNSVMSLLSSIIDLNNTMKESGKNIDYDIDYSELIGSLKDQLTMVGSPFASCFKKTENICKEDILPNNANLDSEKIQATSYSTKGRGMSYNTESGDESEDFLLEEPNDEDNDNASSK